MCNERGDRGKEVVVEEGSTSRQELCQATVSEWMGHRWPKGKEGVSQSATHDLQTCATQADTLLGPREGTREKRDVATVRRRSINIRVWPMYVRTQRRAPYTSHSLTRPSMPADNNRCADTGKNRMAATPLVCPVLRVTGRQL